MEWTQQDILAQLMEQQRAIEEVRRQECVAARVRLGMMKEHSYIPKNKILDVEGQLYCHPVTYLRIMYPESPVWSTRTAGHRELERERRLRVRG